MIIDVHTHIFPPEIRDRREEYLPRDTWFGTLYADPRARMATAEDLLAVMDVDGVDRAVAGGFAWADQGLCREHNDYLLDCVARYPDRLIGIAVVQPRAGATAANELRRCLEGGMRGLGELFPDGQGYSLEETDLLAPLVDILQAAGLPLLTHTSEPVGHEYHGKGQTAPAHVVTLARAFPELTIICAHWGGGLPFYELMPEVRQVLQHVYYDTAASPYLYRWEVFSLVAQMVGVHKILFGSDYPLIRPKNYIAHLRALPLQETDRAAILGGNAARLWSVELGQGDSPHSWKRTPKDEKDEQVGASAQAGHLLDSQHSWRRTPKDENREQQGASPQASYFLSRGTGGPGDRETGGRGDGATR